MTSRDIVRRIASLQRGERLMILNASRERLGDVISGSDCDRCALLVSCLGHVTPWAILDDLLDDLADLALARWPREAIRPEPASPTLADPWLKAASKRVELGLPPRFRRMAPELQFARLLKAIDPGGVVLVWEVDPASPARARPVIEALEWCMRQDAPAVVTLAGEPPETSPYDRLLYGACEWAREEPAVAERFFAPPGAHHASVIEQRVALALERDADLRGLFACNAPVPVGQWGERLRVDLLCDSHRIVVELDGPEHRAEPKFSDDRHRDYELLTAGYLVLRLTNHQVATDLPLAIEKIRSVVRLRRVSEKGSGR